MELLGVAIGPQIHNFVQIADDKRISSAELSMTVAARAAASSKKAEQASQMGFYEVEEGLLYGPGIAD